ncbi:hypothetical protein [Agaribacterium haliotis]|uniref:hypothetical protein n=1 Tax=Agaribacterium haliotis TaxID=2013869 RepID=UPI001304724A|nr:hypothetical protein [Agaribacterium haliotis]
MTVKGTQVPIMFRFIISSVALTLISIFFSSFLSAEETSRLSSSTTVRGGETYPTLEERALGTARTDRDTEAEPWPYSLPFMAQQVIDLGFDLPRPYGFAIIPNTVRQDLILTDLSVRINDGQELPIDFVDFGTPRIENQNVQLKADAWLFPFMNVYVTYGKMQGQGEIPISIAGEDLLGFLGIDCSGLLAPKACARSFSGLAEPSYRGSNVSLGTNLAMGWRQFFVTLPMTYAWTDVDIVEKTVTAINISPRFGVTGDVQQMGTLAVYAGATYLDTDVLLPGRVSFDTSDIPGLGDQTDVDFNIRQENKDKWNLLLGFNWDISKAWSVQSELGTLGSRDNLIMSVTYRP